MIPENKKEEILSAISLEDIITKSGVQLKAKGKVLVGKCPFHDDHSPSLTVWPETQSYHCFVCQKGGNAITYVRDKYNLGYVEALKKLAEEAHVELDEKPLSEEEKHQYDFRKCLYSLCEDAAAYFVGKLEGYALDYAKSRFADVTITRWRLGTAPDGWHELYDYLKGKGYTDGEMLAAGLVKKNTKGTGYYDFFRNRLMFPVFSRTGAVIGFSGRDLSHKDDVAKYINTPETDIYKKGNELFGLNFAVQSIKKYDVCHIVEGNADVIRLHQLGVYNVVAACGTALTENQVNIISKYTKNICLIYDSDSAGQKATERSAELIYGMGMNALVLTIPNDEKGNKQDPDIFFRSKEQFRTYYNEHKANYLIRLAYNQLDNCSNDANKKADVVKRICGMFFNRPKNELESLVIELSKVIGPASLWKTTIKELKQEKLVEENERKKRKEEEDKSQRQNEMWRKYGFYERDNCYWFHAQKGEGEFCGSNFIMEPLFHIESTINAKRLYRLTNEYKIERVVEFPQKDLISLAAFKLRCESLGNFRFEAGDYGLAKIKAYLYEKTQTCKEVTQLGWQRQGFFAWANGIFADGKFTPITRDGICEYKKENYYIPAMSSFYASDDSLYMFERRFKNMPGDITLYNWLDLFCKVYKSNAIVGFSYYVATLFRDIIVGYFRFFPILNIFGVKGSGKSEMAVSLTKLFGDLPVGLNMTNSTIAAMADHVAQTRNALCHIDEYKNSIEYDKVEFLKGLWDGTGRNRMNMDKDKKKEMTAVDAGIILTGQEMPKADIALFSRVIFTAFSKTSFTEDEKNLFNQLKAVEKTGLTHITNEILSLRGDFTEKYLKNYSEAGEDLEQRIGKNSIEDRIWRNWCVIAGALRTIKDMVKLPFSYEKAIDEMAAMIKKQNEETLKDNEVNTFWDIFSFLAQDGQIEEGYDFKILYENRLKTNKVDIQQPIHILAINKTRILQLYQKHCNVTKQKPLPLSTLKFYLQNSPQYLGEKVMKIRKRTDHLIDKATTSDGYGNVSVMTISTRLDCFAYDELGIDVEVFTDDINTL